MVNDSPHTTTNHSKSELDKFRVFYEFVTPQDKRTTEKGSQRSIQRKASK